MKKKYRVYFEFYGKKMQTTVTASSMTEAKSIVRNNVNFLKIVTEKEDPVDYLKNIFGI